MKRCFYIAIASLYLAAGLAAQSGKQKLSPVLTQPAVESAAEEARLETGLQPFGYSFFQPSGMDKIAVTAGAMTPEYQLGAGDRLAIYLGGKAQETFEAVVSADGQLFIPTLGVLPVQGLSFAEFKQQLQQKLQRVYTHFTLDVMLVEPKWIRVGVTGEVRMPGQYTITALSSVLDAVSQADGPTAIGSLRDIQVFRGDSLVLQEDLYDYLLKPGAGVYGRLQSGDQIFVPVCRKRVEVRGEVYRPAIYEINPRHPETLTQIVALAGGLTDDGYAEKLEYSHREETGDRRVRYLDWSVLQKDPDKDPVLQNEDRIQIFSRLDQIPKKLVTIFGEVNRPGEYEFEENMRVSDLIYKAGYLNRSAYMLSAQVARVEPMQSAQTIDIDLVAVLLRGEREKDLLLGADDQLFVRRIPGWRVGQNVELRGEVKFPGLYPIVKDSSTLKMLLTEAGGFTDEALVGEAKLIRKREAVVEDKEFLRLKNMARDEMSKLEYEYFVMKQNNADIQEIVVDFQRLMRQNDRSQDVFLEDGDLIYVPQTPKVVMISGRVSKPGGVVFQPNANLEHYIRQAGGYTWDADGRRTKVIKVTGEICDDEEVHTFVPGDRIWVPRKADHNYWQIFRDVMLVAGQIATMYLVIHTATD